MTNDANNLMTRRKLLMKLGLAAGVAYVAPTLAGQDMARASGASSSSGPSKASAPSRPSRPSKASSPSRPNNARADGTQWRWDMTNMRWVRN